MKNPGILSDYTAALSTSEVKGALDKWLVSKENVAGFATLLVDKLVVREGGKVNVVLINSLTLYLGVVAINQSRAVGAGAVGVGVVFDKTSASRALLQALLGEMEPEG